MKRFYENVDQDRIVDFINDLMSDNSSYRGSELMYYFWEWNLSEGKGDNKAIVRKQGDTTTLTREFIMAFDVPYLQSGIDSIQEVKVRKWYRSIISAFKKELRREGLNEHDSEDWDIRFMDNEWDDSFNLLVSSKVIERDNGVEVECNASINGISIDSYRKFFDADALATRRYEGELESVIFGIYDRV